MTAGQSHMMVADYLADLLAAFAVKARCTRSEPKALRAEQVSVAYEQSATLPSARLCLVRCCCQLHPMHFTVPQMSMQVLALGHARGFGHGFWDH